MPDDMETESHLRAQHGKRKVIPIFTAALVIVVLLCLVLARRRSPAERLPQSIEQYRAALHQPDFGMFFSDFSRVLPRPNNELSLDNAKHYLDELLGRRHGNLGSTKTIGNLVADYSAVARKRVSFGSSWLKVTNDISYDDSVPRTRRETLNLIENILRTNGGFIVPLNHTNAVLLTQQDFKDLGHPIPNSAQP
jgi:hypothetical protein